MRVLDYSAGRPGAAAIKAAGFAGALRYLPKKGHSDVVALSASEVADFRAHGLLLGLIYEDPRADWMLGGFEVGRDRAEFALAQARALGLDQPRCIYLADDQPQSSSGVARVMQTLDGARSVLGLATGVYGFRATILAAMQQRKAFRFWQTGRREDLVAGCHLYQRSQTVTVAGVICDIDDVLQPDFGQHLEEDDMARICIVVAPGRPELVYYDTGVVKALANGAEKSALLRVARLLQPSVPTAILTAADYDAFLGEVGRDARSDTEKG